MSRLLLSGCETWFVSDDPRRLCQQLVSKACLGERRMQALTRWPCRHQTIMPSRWANDRASSLILEE